VLLSGGDYLSADLSLRSNLILRIDEGSRLLSAVNQTSTALLVLYNIQNVEVVGPGTLYGNAEHYISYYDSGDDR
jgi:polygalacturonase